MSTLDYVIIITYAFVAATVWLIPEIVCTINKCANDWKPND